MTTQTPDITAIVVNWNTRDLLRRCLDSLYDTAGRLDVEVVVVDNGSRDGSREMVRSAYPRVTLLENPANAGFARANNQGAAYAHAPLLLLINSDAAVRPGSLSEAVTFMGAHPEAGIVGLQLLNDDLSLQPSGRRFPSLTSTIVGLLPVPTTWRHAYDRRRDARDYTQIAEVDEVSGAAMVVRRDLFALLGGFDESYYFFGEDIDLCWRARKAGYRVVYLPAAQAIHSWGSARSRTPSIRQGLLSQRAQARLIRRHQPAWQATVLRAYLIGLTVARTMRAVIRLRRSADATMHGIAQLYLRELLWLIRRRQ